MRKAKLALAACLLSGSSLIAQTSETSTKPAATHGVVNFNACLTDSKQGIKSRQTMEALNNKLVQSLGDIDKQLADIDAKLNDQNYRDGLSPQADEQLRQSHDKLAQERDAMRTSFSQQFSQTQMSLFQDLMDQVAVASKKIAQRKNLQMIFSGESVTYFDPDLDVTSDIVQELNLTADQSPALTSQDTSSASSTATPASASKEGAKSK